MSGLTGERLREVIFGLVLLGSVLMGLAAAELAYRAYKAPDGPHRIDWTALVAAVGRIDARSGRPRFEPGSSFGVIDFNSFGLRGPEPEVPAPGNVVRIAFVGDSKVMSANYPENLTLAAQTKAALTARVSGCRFDYLTIAGPEYGPALLAEIWAEVAPTTQPDMVVMLVGSVEQLVRAERGRAGPVARADAAPTWLDAVIARSDLMPSVRRQIVFASAALTPASPVALDLATLSRVHRRAMEPLVAAIGTTPVLAVGYRSRLREGQSPLAQARYTRSLRAALPGLAVPEAVTLSDFNVAELARLAGASGWLFADPLADMAADDALFVDDSHLSDIGLARLAETIADIIAPAVQPDCMIDLGRAQSK